MAEWSLDIEKWCGTQKEKVVEVKNRFAFNLYSSIVKKTPVDTGRARGNWNPSVGSPDLTVDENATQPKVKDVSAFPQSKGDEPIYISNDLPYIRKLEFGEYPNPPKKDGGKTVNGYSRQAPQGMVGITVANAGAYLRKALNDVNNGK